MFMEKVLKNGAQLLLFDFQIIKWLSRTDYYEYSINNIWV